MATAMTSRRSAFDDDEIFDDEVFDRRYYPKRVYKDGYGPRVSLMLTDVAPPGRWDINDAALHRPHPADLRSAELQDALRAAADARGAYIAQLQDAWRGPGSPRPPRLKDGESPRDAYVRQISNAWKTLPDLPAPDQDDGDPRAKAAAIEAQRRRWASPGATPGPGPAKDAAATVADRDAALDEYVNNVTNGWRRDDLARHPSSPA